MPQTTCAWCLREQGRPMGNGSHGICTRHAEQLKAQSAARKAAKKGNHR